MARSLPALMWLSTEAMAMRNVAPAEKVQYGRTVPLYYVYERRLVI